MELIIKQEAFEKAMALIARMPWAEVHQIIQEVQESTRMLEDASTEDASDS